ncbi:hypothetical protein BC833DRAFT_578003 [Globomyces pollinis-pini]|nr:hypothetical protein BC833DRAFT_578003 [Globomyces pollinis-pini]
MYEVSSVCVNLFYSYEKTFKWKLILISLLLQSVSLFMLAIKLDIFNSPYNLSILYGLLSTHIVFDTLIFISIYTLILLQLSIVNLKFLYMNVILIPIAVGLKLQQVYIWFTYITSKFPFPNPLIMYSDNSGVNIVIEALLSVIMFTIILYCRKSTLNINFGFLVLYTLLAMALFGLGIRNLSVKGHLICHVLVYFRVIELKFILLIELNPPLEKILSATEHVSKDTGMWNTKGLEAKTVKDLETNHNSICKSHCYKVNEIGSDSISYTTGKQGVSSSSIIQREQTIHLPPQLKRIPIPQLPLSIIKSSPLIPDLQYVEISIPSSSPVSSLYILPWEGQSETAY